MPNFPASSIKGRQPRPSWAGAWKTPTKPLMQDGCGKFTITWESWPSRRENRARRKTTFGGAATKTLTDRLRSSHLFRRKSHPGTHFPHGASARSCRAAYTPCPGSSSSEYYFVVSDDRQELIGIDAGTHSDWDHVGGHKYFRALNPRLHFYARDNYGEEIARGAAAPGVFNKSFFGERFSIDDVLSFKPDFTIDRRTELKIGGTRIELIPVQGGETHDAMLIHLPDQNVMFVGDFIMPYLGAPFVQEGDLQGLLDAIYIVAQKNPRYLLHGHEPLTRNFASATMLAQLKTDLVWLRDQILGAMRRGDERGAIHRANLIPPGLLNDQPDVYQPYLIMREHVIDRLYHQNIGYWQPDSQGLEHLTRADQAELLVDYLGVSESQLVKTVERLTADGKYELAASLMESSGDRFARSAAVTNAKRLVYLKLMEKHQNTDPFKFIIYSSKIGEQTPQMPTPK